MNSLVCLLMLQSSHLFWNFVLMWRVIWDLNRECGFSGISCSSSELRVDDRMFASLSACSLPL